MFCFLGLNCISLFLSRLITYQSYLQTSFYSPTNLDSLSFGRCSYLHSVFYARVPKFLSSVFFLTFLKRFPSKSLQYHALISCSILLALRQISVSVFYSSPLYMHSSSRLPFSHTVIDKVSCLTSYICCVVLGTTTTQQPHVWYWHLPNAMYSL